MTMKYKDKLPLWTHIHKTGPITLHTGNLSTQLYAYNDWYFKCASHTASVSTTPRVHVSRTGPAGGSTTSRVHVSRTGPAGGHGCAQHWAYHMAMMTQHSSRDDVTRLIEFLALDDVLKHVLQYVLG